ncbi:54S ribosomal protein L12, mitochondrial [Malassezia psittaci]|uniref:54S ribosomal protein L12, mitochondrial n=1 Tax=Malassezia psittaci TaxID=1821823 RepID=A0AAF0FDC6_9BASI|nr:54S ribosomal protein L12, mitochondrial [Malassezia psittaci]
MSILPRVSRGAALSARRLRVGTPMGMRLMSRTACVMEEAASPKINSIVDEIEKLTLLEASELVSQLKTRLNITDIAMPSAAAPAAPTAAKEEEPAEEKPKEKTLFTIRFGGLNADTAKAKVIKEIKAINSTMNLVEAKKFVESAPQTLKENVTKEDAEKIKAAIEAAGGKVELV